jgi:MbtH protein
MNTENEPHFKVLINDEEQYSLWEENWPNPCGWRETGKSGSRQQCVDYVDEVWTDMRPLSLRKHMEAQKAKVSTSSENIPTLIAS